MADVVEFLFCKIKLWLICQTDRLIVYFRDIIIPFEN